MRADGVQMCFDATSAYAHRANSAKVNARGALMIDLTPAAIGPYCVPCAFTFAEFARCA